MIAITCASCWALLPVPSPTLMVMSALAFQSRGSTVTHWLRSRTVCACDPFLRIAKPSPLVLQPGEGLSSIITYNNTTSRAISFGLTSEDEMGIIFGYTY